MKGPGRYTKEFKIEAIRLMDLGDRPVSQIAMELGVKRTLLYRCHNQGRFYRQSQNCPCLWIKRDTSPISSRTVPETPERPQLEAVPS
ncbi:MAG: transposase [Candidatus Bathyarchaeota archaeon]